MSNCPRCGTVRLLPTMPTLDGRPVQMCSVCHRIDLKETWDERRDFHQQAALSAAEDAKRAHDALAAKIDKVRAFARQQHDEIKATYDFTGALDSHRHGYMSACADILAILAPDQEEDQ